MKLLLPCLVLFSLSFLCSCKKSQDHSPAPVASFNFRGDNADSYKLGSGDTVTLFSHAANVANLSWDLGNGTSSAQQNVVLSYPTAGTYNVTLKVTGRDGNVATITKKVTVLDRVLKTITVKSLYWDPIPQDIDHFNYVWPQTSTADVFVQLQQFRPSTDAVAPYSGLLPNSPVLLTSAIVPGVANKVTQAFNVPFSGRFLINKQMAENSTLVMSLMARDASGKVYNLMSNLASGSSWAINDDIEHNTFTITCGLMSTVILYGQYE